MALSHAQPAPLQSPFNKRNQYHSTLELGEHSGSKQSLTSLSQCLFYFSAYSLVGTALMGASISVVILQSRQLYFLNLDNNPSATTGPSTTPSAVTTVDTADSALQSLALLLRTTWLPVTVWALALMSTTTLWSSVLTTKRRKQQQQQQHLPRIPSFSSPRTSLLLSHLLYGVFWVLLSAIQETQERLFLSPSWSTMAKTRAVGGEGATMFFSGTESSIDLSMDNNNYYNNNNNNNNNYHAQDGGMGSQQMSKHHQQALDYDTSRSLALQSTALPLCVVWYCAIIALGVATGLLATCSGVIEKQLQDEYDERWVALKEQDPGSAGKGVSSLPTTTTTMSSPSRKKRAAMTRQFSIVQKLTLGLLVLVMFTMEMGFFQWMLSAAGQPMTLEESSSSRSGPLSTRLCLVGLLWTTTMMTLGARLVPASRS